MSTLFDHWHVYLPFLMEEALLSISPAGRGQLVKMLISLEPHSIFGSNFAYAFNLSLSSKNGDEAAGRILRVENCQKSQNIC